MKNKGFLTRPKISPLGDHKGKVPDHLPNRVAAEVSPNADIESASSHDNTITPLVLPPAQPVDTLQIPEAAVGKPSRQRRKAISKSEPLNTEGGSRLTLVLKIAPATERLVNALIDTPDNSARTAAKRSLMTAYRAALISADIQKSKEAIANAVPYRIDIKLPEQFVDAVMKVERINTFEQRATVLSRNLSMSFSSFIKQTAHENGVEG